MSTGPTVLPAAAEAHPFRQTLRTYLRAGYPLLYVVSPEEDRAIELLAEVCREKPPRPVFVWSVSRGLCTLDQNVVDAKAADPRRVLPFLMEDAAPAGVFVLEDFHAFLDERSPHAALTVRQLRDAAAAFKGTRKTVVVLSPLLKIPPELEKDLTVLDLDLPGEAELLAVLEETHAQVKDNPNVDVRLEGDARERIVKALSGLTRSEAENALAKVVVTRSRLDVEDLDLLLLEKEQIIRKSGTLEFYASPERLGSIGGLDALKAWLRQRGRAFSEEARAFGLPSPKGLLLVGVPGCGKSLTAKAIAAEWRMPLLKFDLGKVFAGLVGQSEDNMRRALKMAEAVSPCVLWVDEIEKGLAGARGGAGDSGVGARVFGTLLTWMEEQKKPVFTVATANDVGGLPPELLRKGRFDEVFFVDLPAPQERANILAIHLARHHRDYRDHDLARHVAASEGFSGAELEQAVISALYLAFDEGEKTTLEDRHIETALGTTVPLSRSMSERIADLRKRARTLWRLASSDPGAEAVKAPSLAEAPPVPKKQRRIFEV